MTVELNEAALSHARGLLSRNDVVDDERDDWSEHAPTTEEANAVIERRGIAEYAKWHLGEDTDATEGTKGRYLFPYGDFQRLHRCAVISGESRAGQHDHPAVEAAFKELLAAIDRKAEHKARR